MRIYSFIVFVVLFVGLNSCKQAMTADTFHQQSVELFTFYTSYLTTFGSSDSNPEQLAAMNSTWKKRHKADSKTLSALTHSEWDAEISDLLQKLMRKVELDNEQINREIILIKSKDSEDSEDYAKVRRYYAATNKFANQTEKDFVPLYFKFIKRHKLAINPQIEQVRERLY